MSMDELHALASRIGAELDDDKTTIIYNIIDKESEVGSADDADVKPAPKKRGRKSKAEKEAMAASAEAEQTEAPPAPKKRGRKSKAEKEAMEAALRAEAEAKQAKDKGSSEAEPKQAEDKGSAEVEAKQAEEVPAPKKRERKPKNQNTEATQVEETPVEHSAFKVIRDVRPTSLILAQIQANVATESAEVDNPKTTDEKQNTDDISQKETEEEPTYSFGENITAEGVLELSTENANGFLRSSDFNYMPSPDDIQITYQQIKTYGLKAGDVVRGTIKMPARGEKYYTINTVLSVNGCDPRIIKNRSPFENLTPLFPDEKFNLCTGHHDPLSVRIVDLFAPIGKGQRALIVAQPKTGKTILMKEIANAIAKNHPEAYLMMLLIDERPEEVTDMARTVNAEVIASTFDEPAERHVRIAGIVLEKAKRMVECGHDVVIFLDSITRLARAYNTVTPASGKILTGGVDANAMHRPKRFFGAARNIEGGGSLTIIATALIDTGSKMDEVIFEEFKGTGNMELQLDRMLANKRIFPAVNIVQSSTRRDDLLQDKFTLDRMWILRKLNGDMHAIEAMTEMKSKMEGTLNNEEFLISMNS